MSKDSSKLSLLSKIRNFITGTAAEMRRCTWPDRRHLSESTLLVIVAVIFLGCFVAVVDQIAMFVIRFLTVGSI